ncbi:SURF1 family protein [Reinekea sp.]|jgi:cytochrome oxidase assembly protein ShyY1|uniref:SURF1 family protein n=1 Tax=Reinekea sp. TaxID=1970455 RepID=UPI002A7FC42F|nr:SURF1 family protein [Reinekea sp.]
MDAPQNSNQPGRFQPGLWLWLFTACLLPSFIALGIWQLNRGADNSQLLALGQADVLTLDQIDWQDVPLYRDVRVSGQFSVPMVFLLDNQTLSGQFGYEVWSLMSTPVGNLALSLGWVAGDYDRSVLPSIELPQNVTEARVTLRPAPKNALFDVDSNLAQANATDRWVVQGLSTDWLEQQLGTPVLAFGQLLDSTEQGLGPNIWQASVMTPAKHLAYAIQWFSMAVVLLCMFLYAGFKTNN